MDLIKNGKLLCDLRKAKGMTQKQLADILGIVPKTVSKWETGRGFPDISTLSALSEILGVSEKTLLSGRLTQNAKEVGNMKRIKFFVCPHCGSFMQTSVFTLASLGGVDSYYYMENTLLVDDGEISSFSGYEELDIQTELKNTDILLLEVNQEAIDRMSFGFIDYLLDSILIQ